MYSIYISVHLSLFICVLCFYVLIFSLYGYYLINICYSWVLYTRETESSRQTVWWRCRDPWGSLLWCCDVAGLRCSQRARPEAKCLAPHTCKPQQIQAVSHMSATAYSQHASFLYYLIPGLTSVAWWCNGYGIGLVIERSWVRLPASRVMTLGKLFTHVPLSHSHTCASTTK